MLLDWIRTKKERPPQGGGAPLETVDISEQVPEIDDVLAAVDAAIAKANRLEEQIKPPGRCGCF